MTSILTAAHARVAAPARATDDHAGTVDRIRPAAARPRTAVGPAARVATRRATVTALHDLRRFFRGPLHLPGSDVWEERRRNWSGTVVARPSIVAEAVSAADVRAAVQVAADRGLPLAIQGTGHGTQVAVPDGGLLLSTRRMTHVSVDPEWEVVRVGAGATWADVIAAAAPYGLAPTSGDTPSVGVAGFTLGGGVGWLARKHGLAADNLLRAEVVTAAGRLVAASTMRNSDLFWALRGGGANFGAVTALELRLHRVPRVHAGLLWFPFARAAATLERYRTWALTEQPRELTTAVVLARRAPEAGIAGPALGLRVLYAGDRLDAERALRGLFAVTGAPVAGALRTTPYAGAHVGGTAPRCFELLEAVPDAAVEAITGLVAGERPLADVVELRCWDGAIADAGPDAGPAGHRGVPFSLKVDGPRESVAPLAAHVTGGSFLNFLQDQRRTADAYTPADWERLRAAKQALDPMGRFGLTHAIPLRTRAA